MAILPVRLLQAAGSREGVGGVEIPIGGGILDEGLAALLALLSSAVSFVSFRIHEPEPEPTSAKPSRSLQNLLSLHQNAPGCNLSHPHVALPRPTETPPASLLK